MSNDFYVERRESLLHPVLAEVVEVREEEGVCCRSQSQKFTMCVITSRCSPTFTRQHMNTSTGRTQLKPTTCSIMATPKSNYDRTNLTDVSGIVIPIRIANWRECQNPGRISGDRSWRATAIETSAIVRCWTERAGGSWLFGNANAGKRNT